MADFTVTVTLSGVVNGKTVNLTHSYTAEDVVHVNDVSIGSGADNLFSSLGVGPDGVAMHTNNGIFALCLQLYEGEFGIVDIQNDTNGVAIEKMAMVEAMPILLHQGPDFDGMFGTDTSPTFQDPDQQCEVVQIVVSASKTFRGCALLKPVS